jgi:hypothetical protein
MKKINSRRSRIHCKETGRTHNRSPCAYAEYEAGRIYFHQPCRMEMEKQTAKCYLPELEKNSTMKFKCDKALDNSGWVVERLA